MFITRLISGIVLLAITIFLVGLGGNLLFAAIVFISFIGLFELYRVFSLEKSSLGYIGYLAAAIYDILVWTKGKEYFALFTICFLLALMVFYVFQFPKYTIENIAIVFLGLFYVVVMLSYIYQVRILIDGVLIVWLIFIGAWGSDTCAYAVGKVFGKHKLPAKLSKLSPNKSIEGCIGGILGAALIGFLYGIVCKEQIIEVTQPQLAMAVIGGVSSIISQVGDLTASAIKRNHNIKDYGKLIPGHGGILDRFDSIIFTAPIVYFLALLF